MSNLLVEALEVFKKLEAQASTPEGIKRGSRAHGLILDFIRDHPPHDQSGVEEVKAIDVIKRAYKETEKLDFSEHMMDDQLDKAFLIANEVQDILGIYLEGDHKLWKEEYATPNPEGERDYTKGGSGECKEDGIVKKLGLNWEAWKCVLDKDGDMPTALRNLLINIDERHVRGSIGVEWERAMGALIRYEHSNPKQVPLNTIEAVLYNQSLILQQREEYRKAYQEIQQLKANENDLKDCLTQMVKSLEKVESTLFAEERPLLTAVIRNSISYAKSKL